MQKIVLSSYGNHCQGCLHSTTISMIMSVSCISLMEIMVTVGTAVAEIVEIVLSLKLIFWIEKVIF